MVRRTCILYIYDLFFGFLHNSLFSGLCKFGYGDEGLKKKKVKDPTKKDPTKKKVKDRKHREKEDESQANGARLKVDKTENAED